MRPELPFIPCGRVHRHHPHLYVTSPGSVNDIQCDGSAGPRRLHQLVAERPVLAEVGVGGPIHALAVSAA